MSAPNLPGTPEDSGSDVDELVRAGEELIARLPADEAKKLVEMINFGNSPVATQLRVQFNKELIASVCGEEAAAASSPGRTARKLYNPSNVDTSLGFGSESQVDQESPVDRVGSIGSPIEGTGSSSATRPATADESGDGEKMQLWNRPPASADQEDLLSEGSAPSGGDDEAVAELASNPPVSSRNPGETPVERLASGAGEGDDFSRLSSSRRRQEAEAEAERIDRSSSFKSASSAAHSVKSHGHNMQQMLGARKNSFSDFGEFEHEETNEPVDEAEMARKMRRKLAIVGFYIALLLGLSMTCALIEMLRLPLCAFQCLGIGIVSFRWEDGSWIATRPGRKARICTQICLTFFPLLIGGALAYLAVTQLSDGEDITDCDADC